MNQQIRLNQSYANLFGEPNLHSNLSRSMQNNDNRANTTDATVSSSRQPRQLTSADLRSPVLLPLVEIIEEPSNSIDQDRLLRGQPSSLSFPYAPRYQNNDAADNKKKEDDDDIFAFLNPQSAIDEIEGYYHHPQVNTSLLYCEPAFTIPFPRISQNQKIYDGERGQHHQPCYDNAFAGISTHMTTITPSTKLTDVQEHWINMWTTGALGHSEDSSNGSSSNKDSEQQQERDSGENEEHFSYFSKDGGLFNDNHQQDTSPPPRKWSKIVGDGRPSMTRSKAALYRYNRQQLKKEQPTKGQLTKEEPTKKDAITCLLQQEQSSELQESLNPTRATSSASNDATEKNIATSGVNCSSAFVKNDDDAHDQLVEDEMKSSQQRRRSSTFKNNDNPNDSFSYNSASINNNPPTSSKQYPVVMISNFPWNLTIKEMEKFLSLSPENNDRQYVHIMIDKATGKAQKEAFVEFDSELALETTMKKLRNNGTTLKGRKMNIQQTSPEQAFRKIFPRWQGLFVDGKPAMLKDSDHSSESGDNNEESASRRLPPIVPPMIVEGFEYESLLNICRNYKMRYSRKCPERPFENFISLMVKFPWSTPEIITTMQRDHLYEYYKLAVGALRFHMNKPNAQFNNTLMLRMVRTALICPGLTVNQKKGILTASQIPCPVDLAQYLETPSDDHKSV